MIRLRRVFKLNADCAFHCKRFDFAEIGAEVHDTAARRKVAVYLAVAIAQVDMYRLTFQAAKLFRDSAGQLEV